VASAISVADLRSLMVRSELVAASVLDDFVTRCQATGAMPADAASFAAAAVAENLLTSFQAKLLLQGKWKNFFLSGKYKVLEHLGSGGMGAVFLCEHRHMRRRVAVKVLPPDPGDPTHAQRYQREAQAIAMLDHPNIVRAFDLDREGGLHFLVMEYIDGASLQYLIDSRGPLPVNRAINYIAQAALGLQHAADAGLVHRDVKPSNLMLDWAGTVKLLDLGLARFARRVDNVAQVGDSKTVLGTADYLAPEQARSSSVDVRADVYALGAVAYFLLTGKPPFDGGSVAQKLIRHQTEVPKPVDAVRSEIPAGVAAVIARMLAKDPAERPQSPARVIAELRSWIVDVPPPTPDDMPPTRFTPGEDMDTKARNSTMAMMSRSSRDLLLKTMIAARPVAESAS
jgi:eukaryotic-like serine/threonine-protein kinase